MASFTIILAFFSLFYFRSVIGQDFSKYQQLRDPFSKRDIYDDVQNTAIEEHVCLSRPFAVRNYYNGLAENYDSEIFHVKQAKDYIEYAKLKPGQNVLDLATGTGLVAIAAKKIVGSKGKVYGIDLTESMLASARHKAKRERLPITFIRHDINDIFQLLSTIPDRFDVITCAAAFSFTEDAVEALRQWALFLKPGGRIIFDVPPAKQVIVGYAIQKAAQELNLPTFNVEKWITSTSDLDKVIRSAGLEPQTFKSPAYGETKSNVRLSLLSLRHTLKQPFYRCLRNPILESRASEILFEESKYIADKNGMFVEKHWFFVGIATKPA